MDKELIYGKYGGSPRIRVCGILVEGNSVLLIKHKGLGTKGELWLPPGGGVEFGDTAEDSLKREFLEETGLKIEICDFLFVSEFLMKPLHAMELFFSVKSIGGELTKGKDPELEAHQQIIDEVKMMDYSEINSLGRECLHGILRTCNSTEELLNTHGFFNFENNP